MFQLQVPGIEMRPREMITVNRQKGGEAPRNFKLAIQQWNRQCLKELRSEEGPTVYDRMTQMAFISANDTSYFLVKFYPGFIPSVWDGHWRFSEPLVQEMGTDGSCNVVYEKVIPGKMRTIRTNVDEKLQLWIHFTHEKAAQRKALTTCRR